MTRRAGRPWHNLIRDDERRLATMVGRRLVEERHTVDVLRDGLTSLASAPLFTIERLGVVMAPEPGTPREVEGVLNPAGVMGPDGHYYLFPRLVAAGHYSRIGIARVRRDGAERPSGVERLGVVLEPQMPYELIRPGVGGCAGSPITSARGRSPCLACCWQPSRWWGWYWSCARPQCSRC